MVRVACVSCFRASTWRACSSRGVSRGVCSGTVFADGGDLGSLSLLGLLGLVILDLDGLSRSVSVEERLVVLLGFDKGILEGVGVWKMSAASCELYGAGERTLRVGKADSKSDGLGLALANIGRGVPHPASVGSDVGGKLHLRDNWEEC